MIALFERIARGAAAPFEQVGERLLKKGAFLLIALFCLFFASVFLTIALYVFVQSLEGSAIAALGVGGAYLCVGLICLFIAMRSRSSRDVPDAAPAKLAQTPPPEEPAPQFAANIDGALGPLIDILSRGGYERERMAVETGAAIAKQLNPLSVVTFAIVAGFILGRSLGGPREPPRGDAS
ncbi:phage holin family protein [Methylocapsa acidiphila]|uniref:phage holin family protein n=1 Tax=Methylocapsa acidiphila TaxID=133552 RepID=UPI00041DACE2|nr:phage holin family protein [Methylocapsa acidiphila]